MATKSVDPTIAAFFKDPDASSVVGLKASQIVAPIVRGEDVKPEELMMGGGLRVVHFILDRSPSMEPVGDMLREDFNKEFIAAVKEAREDDISVLRIGGTSFSSDITPIWKGKDTSGADVYYHSLDNLPALTRAEYDPERGYATALHEAILDGTARALKSAADQQGKTGTAPDVDVVTMTDGANNCSPIDPSVVKDMVTGANKRRVRHIFFYFQTDMGLNDPKAYAINELGYDGENVMVFEQKPGETSVERRKRFRRMMRVMSRVSASKGMSAVKAAAAQQVANATTTDDEDLV
ncbi:MAG: hypothetical protein G01um101470_349 [Parcubacteria group bacterium Gr01-1014_70]|nr:MAG: hypothetical protein G01um101470_349 [Parcubacteria group bacterium Gr01-1014_70]